MNSGFDGVRRTANTKTGGQSVRCVQDDPFVTDARDGQDYEIVTIGSQTWMAENLNVGTKVAGTTTMTDNTTIEKYCYDDSDANCDTDGALYQWDEAMGYSTTEGDQGICMDGWHVPTDAEYYILENYVDGTINDPSATGDRGTDGGTKLKSGGSSGFEGLFAGWRQTEGTFYNRDSYAAVWSSTELGTDARRHYLSPGSSAVGRDVVGKGYGFSIRCIQDPATTMTDARDGQTYATVTIGTQTWMAENLNYGTKLASAGTTPTEDATIEKWCYSN